MFPVHAVVLILVINVATFIFGNSSRSAAPTMNPLKKFVDETFEMATGVGEMKVAEAIFLDAVHSASETFAHPNRMNNKILLGKVMSLAYKGQNIIKMCVHLPLNSKAEKYAYDLRVVAHEIDVLVFSIENGQDGAE